MDSPIAKVAPFLKWAGGKRWLVGKYGFVFPESFDRYFEPFLGGGAVFFYLSPDRAMLSDINDELINCYKSLRSDWQPVYKKLKIHQKKHSDDYYYRVRGVNCRSDSSSAARMLYLNRTCFNGLYRVNLKGKFNVPKGTKSLVLLPNESFDDISNRLSQSEISCRGFEESIREADENDFIYSDPPYTVRHNLNNFIKYNESLFSWSDQVALADSLRTASLRGVKILASNADHESIREIYSDFGIWNIYRVSRKSNLASAVEHRGDTTELLISNYKIKGLEQSKRTEVLQLASSTKSFVSLRSSNTNHF